MKTLDTELVCSVATLASGSENVALNSNLVFHLLEYINRLEKLLAVIEMPDDKRVTNELERLEVQRTFTNACKVIK